MNTLEKNPFTSGPIFGPLLKFMLPVLLANLLQAMYSAVDLMVIGRFAAAETIGYAAQYLRGYSVDCLICAAMLTMLGYFNGCGHATFGLVQGLVGSFVIRIPLILLLRDYEGVTLTHLGLGCASATIASLVLCVGYYLFKTRKGTMFPASLYQAKQTT